MGLIARASGRVEVLAAEPFSISLDPVLTQVHQNEAVPVARHRVLFDRSGGYTGPVYLRVVGFAGRESFDVNPIPEGSSEAVLSFDLAEAEPIGIDFEVEAYSDPADCPGGWPPEA
ncbi:MAG: hypothetical protein PHS14_18180 [Elusimicrobia bacterium]|jgi:hypothetical protein|nr:hypothetical protein [Elusimicrobiota bacterium]